MENTFQITKLTNYLGHIHCRAEDGDRRYEIELIPDTVYADHIRAYVYTNGKEREPWDLDRAYKEFWISADDHYGETDEEMVLYALDEARYN